MLTFALATSDDPVARFETPVLSAEGLETSKSSLSSSVFLT
ncbi:MAG: hypothetical protein AAF065_12405 [Verrucomicrobiota bacterium]